MNSSLKIILQYQINIQILKKHTKKPTHTYKEKDNFTTHKEIAPVSALLNWSTAVCLQLYPTMTCF